jgi:hypothetical protein
MLGNTIKYSQKNAMDIIGQILLPSSIPEVTQVILYRDIIGQNLSVDVQLDVACKTMWDCKLVCNDSTCAENISLCSFCY